MNTFMFDTLSIIISVFVLLTLFKNYVFLLISSLHPVRERLRYIKAVLRKRKGKKHFTYHPKVSVIIPAWNEEVGVLKTIKSALYNGYNNTEIIVVNDGSTDNSDKVVKDFLKKLKETKPDAAKQVNYFYKENGGKGKALNYGIEKATGDIILTVDADSALQKGAIAKLVAYYVDDEIMGVVGNVKVANNKTLIGLAQKLEYYFGFYNKRAHAILGAEYIFGGACASYRKEVFEKIGLFDTENKTEDIEMSMRLRYHGMKCTYAEDVVCFTEGADTLTGLINQRVRWKKGRFDTFAKYKSLFFSTEENHNFFLSFFVLPFSLLAELQLIFEPIAITILIFYSIITSEYLSLAIGILFILIVYVVTALFSNDRPRPGIILAFPFTWPLFYFLDWIEFLALWKSINLFVRKKDVTWQKWERKGIAYESEVLTK